MRKRKRIIAAITILLAGFALYGYFQYQRTNQDLRNTQADQTVDATTLIREFAGDDTLADMKYRKRILAVRGIVKSVDTTNNGVSVILGDTVQSASIRMSMDSTWKEISTIHKGMPITIKGILNGYSKDPTGLLGDEIVFNRGVLVSHQ
ncbi:MAG: OB-fold protein [Pseudobacter sp.]|uniref:OB-fold protein n=1 Tax=Pseudobacter sp. TaxID=2045420 RepID=UPI003F7D5896